jgi:cytochrome c-type biogenesis protein CcmH
LLLTTALLCAAGCDRNTEPYVPGEEAREPDLARIFPDQGAGVGAPQLPEAPTPAAAPRGNVVSAGGAPIRGTIELGPGASAPENAILFVIARRRGATSGPPVAVVRVTAPEFPQVFQIGPGDVMIPGMAFAGELSLSARLDSDGNVMTKLPGDLLGEMADGVEAGTEGVVLVLDQQI